MSNKPTKPDALRPTPQRPSSSQAPWERKFVLPPGATRIKRKPRRPNATDPTSAADLIPQVVARLGGQERALEQRVYSAYIDCVGSNFATRSRPERIREGTLYVRVENSALAHELTLLRQELLQRMTAILGPDVVTALRTRVGPLD